MYRIFICTQLHIGYLSISWIGSVDINWKSAEEESDQKTDQDDECGPTDHSWSRWSFWWRKYRLSWWQKAHGGWPAAEMRPISMSESLRLLHFPRRGSLISPRPTWWQRRPSSRELIWFPPPPQNDAWSQDRRRLCPHSGGMWKRDPPLSCPAKIFSSSDFLKSHSLALQRFFHLIF